MVDALISHYNYWLIIILMMLGLYVVISRGNLVKKAFSNPLPHVLILTAIVVGIATTALGLALVVRIRESYGTIEEDDILISERSQDASDINGSSA